MKKKTEPANRNAQSNSPLQDRVIAILQRNPEGIHVDAVAKRVGCTIEDLFVWYSNRGKNLPGVTNPKSSTLGWDQCAAVFAKESEVVEKDKTNERRE
ncbi:MAG: hypothetical protein NTV93_12840 [Verrucomicrobia bacterium]|nr:hypothetical protein [Verrucomicrobiota bacterium]